MRQAGVLAAVAWLRGRHLAAVLWTSGALFSKEEALVLPLLLAASCRPGFGGAPARTRHVLALAVVAAAYLVLHHRSGAFGPMTAPVYYAPTFDPAVLVRNVLEYLDRAGTWPLALLIAACIVTGTRPRLDDCRRVSTFGGAWFVLAHLPTLFLPVRSSLYTLLPSVGVALAAACLLATVWRTQSPVCRWRLLVAAVVLPIVLYPVYVARTRRMAALTTLSGQVIDTPILVPDAGALWLDPPPESPAGVVPPPAPDRGHALVLTLRDGRLVEAAR